MRRRNLFPDPSITGTMRVFAHHGVQTDFVQSDGKRWVRATTLNPDGNQPDAQYSLTGDLLPPSGSYKLRLLARAEGGNGMARSYILDGGKYSSQGAVVVPDEQTVDVGFDVTVPVGCKELIIRICPASVAGAVAMMTQISIEPASTFALASGGGFQASSPRRPRHTDLKAGDRQ